MNNEEIARLTQQAGMATMEAKAKLQEDTQGKRVRDLAHQIQDRLLALDEKVTNVRSDVSQVLDLYTEADAYPFGAFGQDTATIDGLLAELAKEVDYLRSLRRARVESKRLTDEYGPQLTGAAASVAEPQPAMAGQYL